MSEAEAKALADMYGRLSELQTEFTSWKISDKQKFSDKQKEVVDEMANLRRDIAKTETNFSALLNHTADNKAQAKVISWYLLFLTKLVNEKGDLEDYFRGETFDEKLESLYIMEESEDDLLALVYDKLTAFTSFCYFSVSATKEDFENLERDIEEGAL